MITNSYRRDGGDVMKGKLELAEPPFISIQGEGKYVGVPCWFIRFKKCNKKCKFCDTDLEGDSTYVNEDSVMGIVLNSGISTLVFTGGEPLLYQDVIMDIRSKYRTLSLHVESNGSLPLNPVFKHSLNMHWTFSPKELKDCKQVAMNIVHVRDYVVKVIYGMDGFEDILYKLQECGIHKKNIMLMPLGATREELEEITPSLVDYAISNEYRISPRLHVEWGLK